MDTFSPNPDYGSLQSDPGFTIVALLNGNISTYPVGTSETIAFSTFVLPDSPEAANISYLEVSTDVFHSDLECEMGYMTLTPFLDFYESSILEYMPGKVHSPSCKEYFGPIWLEQPPDNHTRAFGRVENLDCLDTSSGTNSSRIIFFVGTVEREVLWNNSVSISILNQTLLACTPRYTIKPMILKLDFDGNLLKMNGRLDSHGTGDIQLFDDDALGRMFQNCLDTATQPGYSQKAVPNATATYGTPYPIEWSATFVLLQMRHDPGSFEAWFERDTIENAARYLFTATSAQIVKQDFMRSGDVDFQGQCHGTKERLRTNALALRIMQAVLVTLTLITVGTWFLRPKSVVSRDPGSIGGLTTVLARSSALQKQISRLGVSPLVEIRSRLCGHQCENPTGSTIEIIASEQPFNMADSPPSLITWWSPMSISSWFILLVIIALALLLGGLEITLRLSKANNGLGTIEVDGYTHYTWVYSPALVMTCMQICVGTIAFSHLLVAPYHTLKRQTSNTRDLLLKDYLSQTAIQSVLETFSSHDWAVLPVTLSIFLTPLLTIVISGLFTTQVMQSSHPTNVTITTALNSGADIFQTVDDWMLELDLLLGLYFISNVSLPSRTFEEFAFPEIRVDDSIFLGNQHSNRNAESSWNGSLLSVQLPAIRSNLDCTYTDTNKTNASAIEETHPSVSSCQNPSVDMLPWVDVFPPFGKFLECSFFDLKPNPEECPMLCGQIGTNETNFTAFSCMSSVSEMTVLTEFSFPSLEILSITPDESSARSFMGNIQSFKTFYTSIDEFGPVLFSTYELDPIFQVIMAESGHSPIDWPMNDFLGEENFPRLASALQHAFRIISSHMADIGLRVPAANDTPPITGTLTNPNVWRLHQNEPSTRVLQALLAAIALCVTISFLLMDVRKLLPKNPCSIAAAASLLADSDMLKPEITPEGAEWMSDSELKKAGVWNGYVFTLGWWARDGEEMRYGIDAGRADASRA